MSWGDLSRELEWSDPTTVLDDGTDDDTPILPADTPPAVLREWARGKRGWEQESEQIRREISLIRAGVPNTPIGRMFAGAYDGPVDVESVRQAWTALLPPAPADD